VDGATPLVMTANLTKSGLGASLYAEHREYGIRDTTLADVREAAAIFSADWERTAPTLADPNLVVSPVNARARISAFIANARVTLLVEDDELYDQGSEDGLIAAARRGANVQVILPQPTATTSNAADGARAVVGSEDVSATSLGASRELGLLIADPKLIATLAQTFQQNWRDAQAAG
jgi:cardiolipin synthase A/B